MTNSSKGLEVLFGPGVQWPGFNTLALIVLITLIALSATFLLLLRNYYSIRDKRKKTYQLFLFKTKQLGLTNYQYKVLNGLVDMLALKNPTTILEQHLLFESSIGRFLSFLMKEPLNHDELLEICRDLIITHEKIYHPMVYRSPIALPDEIEPDTLFFFVTESGDAFIAKVQNLDEEYIHAAIFRKSGIPNNTLGSALTAYIWRTGDAEYSFVSRIEAISGNTVSLQKPEKLIRGKEERLPLVDVMLPCKIEKQRQENKKDDAAEEIVLQCSISKLNRNEAVVKLGQKISYNKNYYLDFVVTDFNVHVLTRVIADRTLTEGNTTYYTFKFIEATDAAKKILKDYLVNHLETM